MTHSRLALANQPRTLLTRKTPAARTFPSMAVMGTGMVGGAVINYYEGRNIPVGRFDPPKGIDDAKVLHHAQIIFVAVPTPYYLDKAGFDESYLRAALDAIPPNDKIVVIKSTVIPGTTERLQKEYPHHKLLFNPEFLTEATADVDMACPNRQIVGFTKNSRDVAELVLRLLPRAPYERIVEASTAETVKYFCNAFYALKVAYCNQMYDLCERMGVEYDEVRDCAAAEPMVGENHLMIYHKGYRGYGGKCLPKDTRSLIQLGDAHGIDFSLLRAAETYNNELVAQQGLDTRWTEGSPIKKE